MNEIDPYLSYTYRPFRIGFCCERPSASEIYEIAALNCTLWGGSYNPIIDVEDAEQARTLVRQYGCDLLYAYHISSKNVVDFVSSFPELKWTDFSQTLFQEDNGANIPVFFDLTACCFNFIRMPDAIEWLRIPPQHPAFPFLALAFGHLPDASPRLPMDYVELMTRSYHPATDLVGDALPESPVLILTELVRRGVRHLPVRRDIGVVVGDTTDPHVLRTFWNIRAAGLQATLFDPGNPGAFAPWIAWQLTGLKEGTEGLIDFHIWSTGPDPCDIPASLNELLSSAAVRLVLSTPAQAVTRGLLSKHISSIRGADDRTALPRVSAVESRPLIQFIPDVLKRRWRSWAAAHCLLEVRSSTHTDQARSLSFRLPYMPSANQHLAGTAGILPRDRLRTQTDGFAIISGQDQHTVRLRGGFGDELLANMFAAMKIEAMLSDKGRYTDRLVRHMGGLQKCRVFKIPGSEH